MIKARYFSELLPELSLRAARSTVSRLGFSNPALRKHLDKIFSRNYGEPGAFLGDPVFEATFGWEATDRTMDSLAGNLLPETLVDAMDNPPGGKKSEYRFPRDIKPYTHQLKSWEMLLQEKPQSVVVTSGTGSGKTECFMVPILSQLAREMESQQAPLVGVRALFLYPLNALIQSQRDRLLAWTSAFNSDIRFCLYNGLTQNKEPQHKRDQTPSQIIDREVLRESPAPMLVTNATMLEYMLVRAQDAPILEASEGKLQWIVLDEAHSYMGSNAAELALLLRRVLHAFKVRPEQVRFVATSATIGDPEGEAGEKLKTFLANLAGVDEDHVHVISGARKIPELEKGEDKFRNSSLEALQELQKSGGDLYQALCANGTAKKIRSMFVPAADGAAANGLSTIANKLTGKKGRDLLQSHQLTLQWLDLLTSALSKSENGELPFLPLRLHAFHNVLAGLWACCDPECTHKKDTPLEAPEWPYGKLFTEERRHCDCGAPIYELRSCNDCNSTFLWGRMVSRNGRYRLIQLQEEIGDEFSLEYEQPEDELLENEPNEQDVISRDDPVLIANGHLNETGEVLVDRESMELDPVDNSNTARLRVKNETPVNGGFMALVCPECGGHHGNGKFMFRKAILGAPFLLSEIIPTVLEFCPDGEKPLAKPLRGRRMITFTDSRQGTARIAAKLQQDSERSRVRGLIYNRVITAAGAGDDPEIVKLEQEIEILRNAGSAIPESLLKDKEAQLEKMRKPASQSFNNMAAWLSTNQADVKDWMHQYYAEQDPAEFSGSSGAEKLANILVIREFARRPKRLNSLETMGLVSVQYPKLDSVTKAPPISGLETGITQQDWREFLKLTLDFHIRGNIFIDLPKSWVKWGGNRLFGKILLPPHTTEQQTPRIKRWPQCNKKGAQNRLVRLLAHVFHLDPATEKGRDIIDTLLRQAWADLVKVGLLQPAEVGRLLELKDMAFAPIEKAWVCPVTRRILDVTLRGVTPYLPTQALSPKVTDCREITVPVCDLLNNDFANVEERIEAVRTWVNSNETIAGLRDEGLWSDLSDRIVEGGSYFRVAEHSAQQSGVRLSDYEKKFKSGRINLLSCSTTMEMGVDIGGISVVTMNNVPPHPANYLQRAGRAGRRAETRSVALTVCKNNPHDQYVFSNTLWAFETVLPAPSISLSSPVIVQRHINSMMLASFLKSRTSQESDLHKLNMEWWMLPVGASQADQFIAWAQCFDEEISLYLAQGMRSLIKHTCYEGVALLDGLAFAAATALKEHCQRWYAEYDAVDTQLSVFQGASQEKEPAFRALSIQRKRLTDEYLLRELASGGFLPGYGFPTDIASLETLTVDELIRTSEQQNKKEGRIDNRMRHRDLPSRDTVTALREYAPGAEVVIDGLVYRSAGITLNWHAPASVKEIKEIQNIREAWRCRSCGSGGTQVSAAFIQHCPECGEALSSGADVKFSYLEPAGFSVDLYTSPHNDVSTQNYIPVEAPWINIEGEWLSLPNPKLGAYRVSSTGSVFHYSSGEHGLGYAICLDCGRAEPMSASSEGFDSTQAGDAMPKAFRQPHRRLRGAQGGDTKMCEGSNKSFSIKPGIRLGHEMLTDVLEIMLRNFDGQPLTDRVQAYSLAVAVRRSITSLLGVEESELGCDTKPVRLSNGSFSQVIVIYDRNASGYCSSGTDRIQEVLRKARAALVCPAQCEDACQHCLLSYDTRFRLEDLDRHVALEFLTDQWINALELQEKDALFGKGNSFAESQNLLESVTREWGRPDSNELRIYLQGDPQEWDVAASPLRNWVQRWAADGHDIKLVLSADAVDKISKADRFALHVLSSLKGVSVWTGSEPSTEQSADIIAEILQSGQSLAWAQRSSKLACPNMEWGVGDEKLLVRGMPKQAGQIETAVVIEDTLPAEMSDRPYRLEILDHLDGESTGFGARMLNHMEEKIGGSLFPGEGDIVSITYHDRYINSPMPISLLIEFITAAKLAQQDRWAVQTVHIQTVQLQEEKNKPHTKVFHNWPKSSGRDAAIVEAFDYCGMECEIEILRKYNALHARLLEFECSDGHRTKIWLDQGFSYWQVPRAQGFSHQIRGASFPFNASMERQGEVVAEPKFPIKAQSFSTYLFVDTI